MMRVLMLSWEYPPYVIGGLGAHVTELTPAMLVVEPDLALHVLTPCFVDCDTSESVGRLAVHRVPVGRPDPEHYFAGVETANQALVQRARELFRSSGPFDLVHVHDWLMSFVALALQAEFRVPLLTTIHATERGRLRGHLYGDLPRAIDAAECGLVRATDRVITCSAAMKREVQAYFGISPERVTTVPNGINTRPFDALRLDDHSAFRRRFALPDEQVVFNVGRLVYEKGADLLVEAVPRILQQVPGAKFVIGGRGPLLGRLQARVQELRLSDKVLLTGFLSVEDKNRLFAVASCGVFPSRYEPFGIVALESMAAGAPVVVADVGGLGAVVEHEMTGLTILPNNVESLAWGVVRTLREPEAAATRAQAALSVAHERFSWDVIARMTVDVYEETRRGASVTSGGGNG